MFDRARRWGIPNDPGSFKRLLATFLVAVLVLLVAVASADAKVPGRNGQIAFARADQSFENSFTYTVSPAGGNPAALFPSYESFSPHWSPNGARVAVVSGLGAPCPPTCTGNTVIINPDTGGYRVLPPPDYPHLSTFCSIWSPDATHFACEGGNDSHPSRDGVYTIRSSDGGDLTRITNAGGGHDIPIDYSPDGTQIVFGRFDVPNRPAHANSALFVVNLDRNEPRRITPWGFSDEDGSWSPNGTEIAFKHRGSLFVVHPDGTGLARIPLAVGGRYFAGDASWSPNGRKIAFLLFKQTGAGSFEEGIATANADGSNLRQITTSPTFDNVPDWGSHAAGS